MSKDKVKHNDLDEIIVFLARFYYHELVDTGQAEEETAKRNFYRLSNHVASRRRDALSLKVLTKRMTERWADINTMLATGDIDRGTYDKLYSIFDDILDVNVEWSVPEGRDPNELD